MSRIGKKPVPLPAGVKLAHGAERQITVTGPNGSLTMNLRPEIDVDVQDGKAVVRPSGKDGAGTPAYHGMTRALLSNMVRGVTAGFERRLRIEGVGWNANAQGGAKLVLNIGFCHPVTIDMPKVVKVETPNPTTIVLKSPDKEVLGNVTATIRKIRPPEPYKGKGILYEGEVVRRKAGKSFGS
jgi:large subunit ribosomal protein L6